MTLKDIGAQIQKLTESISALVSKTTVSASTVTESALAELRQSFTALSATVGTLQTSVTAAEKINTDLTAANAQLVKDLAEANAKLADPKSEAGKKAAEIAAAQGIPAVAATSPATTKTSTELRAEYNKLIAEGKSKEAGEFYVKNFK